MEQKVRGLLAYLFGWLGGLIILFGLKDNNEQTKFNAAQSIVISLSGMVLGFALGFIPYGKYFSPIVNIGMLALQIIGMIKAYKEEPYELPVISDLTKNIFKSKLS